MTRPATWFHASDIVQLAASAARTLHRTFLPKCAKLAAIGVTVSRTMTKVIAHFSEQQNG
jgi:hypothetical protein